MECAIETIPKRLDSIITIVPRDIPDCKKIQRSSSDSDIMS